MFMLMFVITLQNTSSAIVIFVCASHIVMHCYDVCVLI